MGATIARLAGYVLAAASTLQPVRTRAVVTWDTPARDPMAGVSFLGASSRSADPRPCPPRLQAVALTEQHRPGQTALPTVRGRGL